MKVYIGTDHTGFHLKETLKSYLGELSHAVEDMGAHAFDARDDYPDFIHPVAEAVAKNPGSFGVIIGASGQGEAMCANRVAGARAFVYYGPAPKQQTDSSGNTLDIIASTRAHNDANILSLGARFITEEEARQAVKLFLETPFSGDERHVRRLAKF